MAEDGSAHFRAPAGVELYFQALDAEGGHDIGNGWGYHYHAMGTTTVDTFEPGSQPPAGAPLKVTGVTVTDGDGTDE